MKQILLKILKYFLPMLFIAYLGYISLFTHSHVVNGVTIVHSHPYNSDIEHTHTAAEFQLIDILSTIHAADGAVASFTVLFALIFICQFRVDLRKPHYGTLHRSIISLRAPPVSI